MLLGSSLDAHVELETLRSKIAAGDTAALRSVQSVVKEHANIVYQVALEPLTEALTVLPTSTREDKVENVSVVLEIFNELGSTETTLGRILFLTDDGKLLLSLIDIDDTAIRVDLLTLLYRVVTISKVTCARFQSTMLQNPDSVSRIMDAFLHKGSPDFIKTSCLSFLLAVIKTNKDLQQIVTVHGVCETIIEILLEDTLDVIASRNLLEGLATLVKNPTCQRYMRDLLIPLMNIFQKMVGSAGDDSTDQSVEVLLAIFHAFLLPSFSDLADERGKNIESFVRANAVEILVKGLHDCTWTEGKIKIAKVLGQLALDDDEELPKIVVDAFIERGPFGLPLCGLCNIALREATLESVSDAVIAVVWRLLGADRSLRLSLVYSLAPQMEMESLINSALDAFDDELRDHDSNVVLWAPTGREIVDVLKDKDCSDEMIVKAVEFIQGFLHGDNEAQVLAVKLPLTPGGQDTLADLLTSRFCQFAQIGNPTAAVVSLLQLFLQWECAEFVDNVLMVSPILAMCHVFLGKGDDPAWKEIFHHSALLVGVCAHEEAVLPAALAQLSGKTSATSLLALHEAIDFVPASKRFRPFVDSVKKKVHRKIVQRYLAIVPQGMSRDIADHYKDLIKKQDLDLAALHKENDELKKDVKAAFQRAVLNSKSGASVHRLEVAEEQIALLREELTLSQERQLHLENELNRRKTQKAQTFFDVQKQLEAVVVGYLQLEEKAAASIIAQERAPDKQLADALALLDKIAQKFPETVRYFAAPLDECPTEMP